MSNKCTVIVPVFNSVKTVGKVLTCLEVLAENNIEIIISDNHSTDGTVEILQEYTQKENFTIIFQKENIGHESIKNLIKLVTTPWLLMIGSDDYLMNAHQVLLELDKLSKYNVGLSFQSKFISETSLISDRTNVELLGTKKVRFRKFFSNVGCNSRFYGIIRTDLCKKYIYSENYYGNDVVFSAKILQEGEWLYSSNVHLHRELGVSANQIKLRKAYGSYGLGIIFPPSRFIKELFMLSRGLGFRVQLNLLIYYFKIVLSPIREFFRL